MWRKDTKIGIEKYTWRRLDFITSGIKLADN
jgi:hypothetical protein